jgi:hypothetical protein
VSAPVARPWTHGMQYRYRVAYRDRSGDSPLFTYEQWAYAEEQVRERFDDSPDDGWVIVRVDLVRK